MVRRRLKIHRETVRIVEVTVLSIVLYVIAAVLILLHTYRINPKLFILTSAVVLLGSFSSYFSHPEKVRALFFLAMVFSFLGDLFMKRILRITQHRIIDGIGSFGIAHILYIIGVSTLYRVNWLTSSALAISLSVPLFFLIIYDRNQMILSKAAFVYMVMIALFFATSILWLLTSPGLPPLVLALGVVLFMISDAMIGYRQFRKDSEIMERLISLTYIFGQVLIQLSVMI